MTKPLIRIENLQIFDTIISAEIAEGELNAVIGPNSSGKTTLAEILRGDLRNFKGTVINSIDYRQILYSAYRIRGDALKFLSCCSPNITDNQPPRSKLSRYEMNVIISQQAAEN